MIRIVFIFLKRFASVFLPMLFICAVFFPFIGNLIESLWRISVSRNLIFMLCALIPALCAAGYLHYTRHYVDSEDLSFFLRNRFMRSGLFCRNYFYMTGLVVSMVYGRTVPEEFAESFSSDMRPPERFGAGAGALDVVARDAGGSGADDASSARGQSGRDGSALSDRTRRSIFYLSFIRSLEHDFAADGGIGEMLRDTDDKDASLRQTMRREYLRGLAVRPDLREEEFERLVSFFAQRGELYGRHVCSFLLTGMLRVLMAAADRPEECDMSSLLEVETVSRLGEAFNSSGARLHSGWHNEYFNLINQELFNFRIYFRFHEHSPYASYEDGSSERGGSAAGSHPGETRGNMGRNSTVKAGDNVRESPPEFKDSAGAGDGAHYSYRDSYRNFYREAYRDFNSDPAKGSGAEASAGGASAGDAGAQAAGAAEGPREGDGRGGSDGGAKDAALARAYAALDLKEGADMFAVQEVYDQLIVRYSSALKSDALTEHQRFLMFSRMASVREAYAVIMRHLGSASDDF